MFPIRRALQTPRLARTLHSSRVACTPHSTDSYSKDVDATPPPDSKIHRVDPGSENVQKPHEHPSGAFSEVGAQSAMETGYKTMDKENPYKAPGPSERYGGIKSSKLGPSNGDGPTGNDSKGRS